MFPFITSFLRVWTLISSLMFQKHYVVFSRSSANPCSWPVRSAQQREVRIHTFSWNDIISPDSFHFIPKSSLLFRILAPLRAIWPVRSLQHREGGGERREALWHTSTVWHTTLLVEHSTCVKQCLRHMVLAEHLNNSWHTTALCGTAQQCLRHTVLLPVWHTVLATSFKLLSQGHTKDEHPCLLWQPSSIGGFEEKLRNSWKLFETIFSSSDLPF